jgi:hypothetical protein
MLIITLIVVDAILRFTYPSGECQPRHEEGKDLKIGIKPGELRASYIVFYTRLHTGMDIMLV